MLGVGWTEMLVIGVLALIVIGPKDLPAVMHRVGKFAGTIRRMGNEFQRELNKTTGLNEIRNLRSSITQPLKATTDAIRKEFNTTSPDGTVKPSGAIKPADPNAESVVDEIKAAAGMSAEKAGAAAAAPQMTPKEKPGPVKAAPRAKAAAPAKTGATGKSAAARAGEGADTASAPAKAAAAKAAPAKAGATKKSSAKPATPKGAATKTSGNRRPAAKSEDKPVAKPRTRKASAASAGADAEAVTPAESKTAARKAKAPTPAEGGDTPVEATPRKRSAAKKA